MNKKIIILFDFHDTETCVSYGEVVEGIQNGTPIIFTHVLDFFSFSTLQKGYDVEVLKKNGTYVLLSELLSSDNTYTTRKIKNTHNVHKLLLANEFTFKNKE